MARRSESEVQTGLLLIADVSGYTAYLSGVELEHSHDILADLVGAVAHSLAGRFEVIEVEGDAVFVHHQGEDLAGAEVMSVAQRCYSEECDDVADLLGGAEAAERDLPSDELGRTKGIPLDMPCFDADATVACLDQA